MKTRPIDSLLNPSRYQVFLLTCPATLPFSFAIHPWFVINRLGEVHRVGVSWRKQNLNKKFVFGRHTCEQCSGHWHKDARPPSEGIEILPFQQKYFWKGTILNMIEGEAGSLADRMAGFIEHSGEKYPYKDTYSLFGPNSNTFAQWILDQFPESGMKLPWNAVGKNKAL